LLEVGVQSGGSSRVWRQYYGARLIYVGVDINPLVSQLARPEERTYIAIGSAGDPDFMLDLCRRYGPFDVVIDDGAHTAPLMRAALDIVMPSSECLRDGGMYVVRWLAACR
jgi:hypothetical protein